MVTEYFEKATIGKRQVKVASQEVSYNIVDVNLFGELIGQVDRNRPAFYGSWEGGRIWVSTAVPEKYRDLVAFHETIEHALIGERNTAHFEARYHELSEAHRRGMLYEYSKFMEEIDPRDESIPFMTKAVRDGKPLPSREIMEGFYHAEKRR